MDSAGKDWLVEVRGVSKYYGAVRAIDHADFTLRSGEVVALLGENGAGKSTLVKLLSGLARPDSGEIRIAGHAVGLHSSAQAQAAGVAVVQQELTCIASLSVAENLALGDQGYPSIRTRHRLSAWATPLLKSVGLDYLDPGTSTEFLGIAERQLLEIARVLARDARIVIFDEPTAALADFEIERVLKLVRRLADEGRGIIFVTHRLPEVFQIASRAVVFRNGKSLPSVDVKTATIDSIIHMMLGRELGEMFPPRGEVTETVRLAVEGLRSIDMKSPVSFTVREGEILGLTGQLGSGAVTALQALAGTRGIVQGRAKLSNVPLDLRTRRAGLRRGVAYCSSDRKADGIFGVLSLRANLSSSWLHLISKAGWILGRRENRKTLEQAREVSIDGARLRSRAETLSGGNQQKVALGKWLGGSPNVLLADEPTRGVDVGARAEIYRYLRHLTEKGMAVIVSSSDTSEILGLCDSISAFYHGQQIETRPYQEWSGADLARAVMHGSSRVHERQ